MRDRTPPRYYTDEFKAEASALLRRGDRSLQELAKDLGISKWTLRGWYNADQMARKRRTHRPSAGVGLASPEETPQQRIERLEQENARLQKRVERLEEDRAILKKAAAFFAKENE